MAFLTPSGALVPVRCKSPNKCSYCAFMSAAEDRMMVLQDALRGPAPSVSLTVTTAKAHTAPADFRRDVEQLFKARLRASRGYFDLPAAQRRDEARAALQNRRAERRFFELLDAEGLTPYDLGPNWDGILQDELERVRLEGECTTLVYVQRIPTEFGPDGLPTAWADEVVGPVHDVHG